MRVPALRITIAAFIVIWSCAVASAQAQAQQDSCLRRTVLVSVVSEKGDAVSGLTAENFRGSFRSGPVRVLSVEEKTVIPRIVIVLDKSGSMGWHAAKWGKATTLAANPAVSFREGTSIALVVFGDKVEVVVPFGQPRQSILDAVASIRRGGPRGRTALYAAVLKAAEILRPAQAGDVIYVVSDGVDSASGQKYTEMERVLLESGVRLFGVVLHEIVDRGLTLGETIGPDNVHDSVLVSGGDAIRITTTGPRVTKTLETEKEISAALSQLFRRMWELHRVEIELPAEVDKPRDWKLELVDTPGVNVRKGRILYARKLMPCPAPASQPNH